MTVSVAAAAAAAVVLLPGFLALKSRPSGISVAAAAGAGGNGNGGQYCRCCNGGNSTGNRRSVATMVANCVHLLFI